MAVGREVPVIEARREAKTVLGRVLRGADRLEEKQVVAGRAITVTDVCDWYLAEAEAGRVFGERCRPIKL